MSTGEIAGELYEDTPVSPGESTESHRDTSVSSEETPEPYRYTPISRVEIRCLVLEPGIDNEMLTCTLGVFQLADDPPYEAISYVWGDSGRDHHIKCGGRRLSITPNLRDALLQCRLPHSRRILWADSVCINQDDDKEKSLQVSIMSKIYSQAMRVLICFGPDRTGGCAQLVQSFLHDINEMFEDTLPEIRGDWDSFPLLDDDDSLLSDSRWSSWASFVRQPWFKRGWVVQEAGLARDALLFWGPAWIHWLWVQRAMAWHIRRSRRRQVIPASADLHISIYAIRYKEEAMTMSSERDFLFPDLPVSLDTGRRLHVTDNRDRIYAFLGLPEAAVIRHNLSIDYEKTWQTVFQDFACCYLDATHDLAILHFIQPTEVTVSTDSRTPSWVPQWQIMVYARTLYIYSDRWRKIVPSLPILSTCRMIGSRILRVNGLIMDSIEFITPLLYSSMTFSDMTAVWRAVVCFTNRPVYKAFPPLLAFIGAITCAVWPAGLSDERKAQVGASLHRLVYGVLDMDGRADPNMTPDAIAEDVVAIEDEMWIHATDYIHNRRVAVTRRGYYCLVPGLARQGDTCALIFGTSMPFILRGAGQPRHYKVVGDAVMTSSREVDWTEKTFPYIVGSGHRANEDWLDWGLEEEDIWLC